MAHLYYREDLTEQQLRKDELVWLDGDEARHALRVARLRIGEEILIGNGAGIIASGEVTEADRDRFAVRLSSARLSRQPAVSLTLVQALAKGDRDERAVEQATEFGVDRIVPWQAARSVSRWDSSTEKQTRGAQKWRKTAREAAKQSLRARIPHVEELTTTTHLAALAAAPSTEMLVLHPSAEQQIAPPVSDTQSVVLVVGPEGGLSDSEVEQFVVAGAKIVRLGDTVLRTSSAGPAALAVLNSKLGYW